MTDWMTVWVRTDVLLHDTCMSFRESGVITSRVGDCRWKRQYVRLVMSLPRELVCLGFGTGVKCQLSLEAFASLYSEPERLKSLFTYSGATERRCIQADSASC